MSIHTGWIQTYTGRKFSPLAPRPLDVSLMDIAHALSNICRFTGHSREFYSVAQHSVFVARLIQTRCFKTKLWALLHDASEAYLCDVAKPVKPLLRGYAEAEERVMRVVAQRFDLPWPRPEEVHVADMKMLATEFRDLMGPAPEDLELEEKPVSGFTIDPLPPKEAKEMFLDYAAQISSGQI